jgi:MYXO-CTERM domain-containing protein
LEPGTLDTVSDTLGQTDDNKAKTFWDFESDSDSGPLAGLTAGATYPVVGTLTENGAAQPAILIKYFDVDGVSIGSSLITIQSDVETPEPSFRLVALAGLLVILGVASLRRRRTA